jgi:hypothetical protein
MSKARDLANAGTALTTVSATELGYLDGVTSAVQTQLDGKEPTLPSQTGNTGKYLTTDGSAKSWGTVSQYALPSQTGNSGKFLTTDGTAESWGTVTVPTAFNYYKLPANSSSSNFSTVKSIQKLNGTWIMTTGNGFILYSTDGKTWTRWASTATEGINDLHGVVFGNNTYVFYGNGGTVLSATSIGGTLTSRTSQQGTSAIYDGVWVGGSINLFILVGANTTSYSTSPDGATWTARSNPQGSAIWSIATNGTDRIVLTSSASQYNRGHTSTNGTTWTSIDLGPSGTASYRGKLTYDSTNTRWIYHANPSTMYYTTTPATSPWSGSYEGLASSSNSSGYVANQYTNGSSFIFDSTNNRYVSICATGSGKFRIINFSTTPHQVSSTSYIFPVISIITGEMPERISGNTITIGAIPFGYDPASGQYIFTDSVNVATNA